MRSVNVVGELIPRARFLADAAGMTLRHTDADLTTEFRSSWTALRDLVSEAGSGMFLRWDTATLAAGAFTGAVAGGATTFGALQLADDVERIIAIEAVISATDIRPLEPISIEQRQRSGDRMQILSGAPTGFFVFNVEERVLTSTTVSYGLVVGVVPIPDRAYVVNMAVLPGGPQGVSSIKCMAGWDDWLVWDLVVKLASRDNDMANTYAIALREREACWTNRVAPACAVQRVAPLKRFDQAGQRKTLRQDPWRRG